MVDVKRRWVKGKGIRERSPSEYLALYSRAMELRKQGLGAHRIAKILNLPEPTVGGWIYKGSKPFVSPLNREVRWSEIEKAYLAGLIDGEGSITFWNVKGHRYPRISISNSDWGIIERIRKLFKSEGIHLSISRKGKQYECRITKLTDVYRTIIAIEPYIASSEKKKRSEFAKKFIEEYYERGCSCRHPEKPQAWQKASPHHFQMV
jgi:Homing endonuclease.